MVQFRGPNPAKGGRPKDIFEMASINFELRRSRTLSTGGQVRPIHMAQSNSHRLDLGQKPRQSPTDVNGMLTFWIKAAAADSTLSYKILQCGILGQGLMKHPGFFQDSPAVHHRTGLDCGFWMCLIVTAQRVTGNSYRETNGPCSVSMLSHQPLFEP